jgi:homocysteine S-methyltransferase
MIDSSALRSAPADNPLSPYLAAGGPGFLIVDGGLATELERRGHDLSDALWSARLLADDPAAIRQLHLDYLLAGADCIISASYQATIAGFTRRSLSEGAAEALLRRSVALAMEARAEFWREPANRVGRQWPLVAASVGPYGAYLADGSEYRGDYGLDEAALADFHRQRWRILAASEADILACETTPSFVEARALAALLNETVGRFAWISFSCRDGEHINDGTSIAECATWLDGVERLAAIGVNCTTPGYISSLITHIRQVTGKPIIVYPNSGEAYDGLRRRWLGLAEPLDFGAAGQEWQAAGASLIGGCCRTGPEHIRQLRRRLAGSQHE